jgi:hypothetical protein
MGQCHAPAAPYPQERPDTHCKEAGWASESVWKGAENLAPTGIRSPDRPACRQSLYRLRYPAHSYPSKYTKITRRYVQAAGKTSEHAVGTELCGPQHGADTSQLSHTYTT